MTNLIQKAKKKREPACDADQPCSCFTPSLKSRSSEDPVNLRIHIRLKLRNSDSPMFGLTKVCVLIRFPQNCKSLLGASFGVSRS
jgi:hypothetical protein